MILVPVYVEGAVLPLIGIFVIDINVVNMFSNVVGS